jgi:hypothetical protein
VKIMLILDQRRASAFMALCLAAIASPAMASNEEANLLYSRFTEAFAKLDSAALEPLYAPGATYLPRSGAFAIQSRDQILARERASHLALSRQGGSLRLEFRIVSRQGFGEAYVDNGYMRSTWRASATAEPKVTVSKFILVMARQPGGNYALVSDADSDAPAEAWDKARETPGLKYDR